MTSFTSDVERIDAFGTRYTWNAGPGPTLEIRFQKDGTLEDAHPPFAEVHRIGWVGVNEGAGGNKLGTLGVGELFSSRRWREDVGKDEESECYTETSAEHPT